jgi:ribosome biogenesis ATPase
VIDWLTNFIKEMGVPFYNISAPSIVSGMSGESEKKIRDVFEEAKVVQF